MGVNKVNNTNSYRLIIILTLFLVIQGCSSETPTPALIHPSLPIPMSTETPTPIPFSTPLPIELRQQINFEYNALIGPFVTEWLELNQLATDWGRTDMHDLIIRMQEIRNEIVQLEVDPSLEKIHSQLILHMDCQIAAHAAFYDYEPGDYLSIELIVEPVELLEEHEVIFERCSFPVVE